MSKVKIQGNASGTGVLTVTAPNTSTDRTITLPDSTGTLATTADVPSSITDNGDATAITIGSDEKVRIGNTTTFENGFNDLCVGSVSGAHGITIASENNANGTLAFADNNSSYGGHFQYNHSDNAFKFYTADTVRARIDSDGLKFGTDTAAVNALDDYEEGTWTPSFTGSSGSAGSVGHSVQEGYYTKIGRLVTCQFNLTLTNTGSWTGEARLTGLPFDPADTFPAAGSVSLDNVNVPNDASSHNVYVNPGVTYFRFLYTQDNGSRTFVLVEQVSGSSDFNGTISYIV